MLVFDGKSKKMQLLLLGAAAVSTLSACAESGVPTSAPMRLGSAAFAPRGYLQFCERRPDQCGLATPMAEADRASLERTLMQEQWANVLNLQPTATAANGAPSQAAPQAPSPAPIVSEVAAPLDLTGSIDFGDKQIPSVSAQMTVGAWSPPLDDSPLIAGALLTHGTSESQNAAIASDVATASPVFDLAFQSLPRPTGLSPVLQAEQGTASLSSLFLGADKAAVAQVGHLQTAAVSNPVALATASNLIASPEAAAPSVLETESQVGPVPQAAMLHLTPVVWAALNGVNQSVNAKIRPMDDQQAFGVADYWTLPLSDGPRPVGNCKHYVLEKRKALVEAGFSPNVLSIAIVKTGWGEVHSVLVVDTDQGDYVLDNLTAVIKPWRDVRYTWIERQTPGKPLRWAGVLLGGEASSS